MGGHKCSICRNFCHDKPPCSQIVHPPTTTSDPDPSAPVPDPTVVCLLCERSNHDTRTTHILKQQPQQQQPHYVSENERFVDFHSSGCTTATTMSAPTEGEKKDQRMNDYYNMSQLQGDKAFAPNAKRYKNNGGSGAVDHGAAVAGRVKGVGDILRVGELEGSVGGSPAFPLIHDGKEFVGQPPCKPFAFNKSRMKPSLFKFSTNPEGLPEWID